MQDIKVTQLELKLNNFEVNQLITSLVILQGKFETEGHDAGHIRRLRDKIVEQSAEQTAELRRVGA